MSNIIDSIRLSGTTYQIQGSGGGGKAIEAGRGIKITTGETADTVSLNVIGDYYGTVDLATSDRSVYNGSIMIGRSYIDNRDHAIAIGTTKSGINGGAKIYGNGGIGIGNNVIERSSFGIVIGSSSSAGTSDMQFSCCAIGMQAESYGQYSTALSRTKVNNESEFGCGKYNVSNTGSTEADNTLFSVGNGTSDSARHNAFEIRQNGDIYLTLDGQDVKLQDHLGGGSSYTAGDGIDITNDVISVTGKVDTTTYNTYTAATDTALASKQTTLTAGTGISIVDNVISAEGGGGVNVVQITGTSTTDVMSQDAVTTVINTVSGAIPSTYVSAISADSDAGYQRFYRFSTPSNFNYFLLNNAKINNKAILSTSWGGFETNFSLVETSAITTSVTSSSTDAQVPSAKAVNDKLGGLSLVKLSQAEYDALSPNYDSNTLYVIVN